MSKETPRAGVILVSDGRSDLRAIEGEAEMQILKCAATLISLWRR
jgi:hypothetical protein